jgi:glycine dehydrogenase
MIKGENFQDRHIGPNENEIKDMLNAVGAPSVDDLINEVIPTDIRLDHKLKVPSALSEREYLALISEKAEKNQVFKNHIGQGYYGTFTPSPILRNIFESPYWYTAYTPYQAEISQGRMESLLNYQTMVCELTGMTLANASLLDEATAAAEAMHLFFAARGKEKTASNANKLFVGEGVFKQTLDVLITRAEPIGVEIVTGNYADFDFGSEYFAAIVQYPNTYGTANDYAAFTAKAKANNIFVGVGSDLLSLTLLTPPGEWGADVVYGSAQRFGVPMGFGGPHAAFFTTRDEFKRLIPGRIIGVTLDSNGNPALRMALQTREQHIKRDKATSNICTAQALLANMAAMYAVYHGPEGLKRIATNTHITAVALQKGLTELGYKVNEGLIFDTVTVFTDTAEEALIRSNAEAANTNFFYRTDGSISISTDELTTAEDVQNILNLFAESVSKPAPTAVLGNNIHNHALARTSEFLTHPVFNTHHSETEIMRYISKLERKDIGLNFSMISLGSCTMKLNAASEMMPLSRPEFNAIHPFAPLNQVKGYVEILTELEQYLSEITGFDAVSLQPNSGAQGEYAGLMVIREYLKAQGQGHRHISLIPSSAHGTNPASAVMAGMDVVVVACDEKGNINVDDLRAKAEKHKDNLACLMVTYPSTHGVYEERIREITGIIHEFGGQVYMDGANMNAQVGLTSPGNIGADVCHLNLHKTFAIPHGGGGPGMGPIGVKSHLAPFLPGHAITKTGGEQAMHAVSAAPWGSALILLISYSYIRMLGPNGLTDSTRTAILNANYMKDKLAGHFTALYTNKNGRVAHEFIADCRDFKRTAGIEVVDIAKRLMDYGFHAPTVSFPVAGTLMIEPTESESKDELDRFIEAMISIRNEIREIENETADRENNVLKHAPHTAEVVINDEWARPYARNKAAFPLAWVRQSKFWPSVGRVNDAYGDRNLMCTCPPLENYTEEAVTA